MSEICRWLLESSDKSAIDASKAAELSTALLLPSIEVSVGWVNNKDGSASDHEPLLSVDLDPLAFPLKEAEIR